MEPDLVAKGTLILFAAIAVAILIWQAVRWPAGWQAWMLSVADRLYLRSCFHVRTNRRCPFPETGPAIIIANHSSPMDPLFIWLGGRRVIGFMMAQEYYERPFVHWISRTMHCIPVERAGRDMVATRAALRRLKEGHLLGVFPEGQLNLEPDLLPGIPGIAWLALHARVPVFPVYLHNSPGGTNMVEPFYNFRRVRLSYGEEIDLSEYYGRKLTHDLLQHVTDILMSRIGSLGNVGWKSCIGAEDVSAALEDAESKVLVSEE